MISLPITDLPRKTEGKRLLEYANIELGTSRVQVLCATSPATIIPSIREQDMDGQSRPWRTGPRSSARKPPALGIGVC